MAIKPTHCDVKKNNLRIHQNARNATEVCYLICHSKKLNHVGGK